MRKKKNDLATFAQEWWAIVRTPLLFVAVAVTIIGAFSLLFWVGCG